MNEAVSDFWGTNTTANRDTSSMCSITNYDATATCGNVGWPLNGFKNPLVLLTLITEWLIYFINSVLHKLAHNSFILGLQI